MLRTIIVILIDWLLSTAAIYLTQTNDPALWWIMIDAAAVWAITIKPAGKMQAAISAVYVAEIVAHFLYVALGTMGRQPDQDYYLSTLSRLADIQLLVFGSWMVWELAGGWIGRVARRLRSRHLARDALAANPRGMGER